MPFKVSIWVTTLPQSISMGALGKPSMAIFPPWFMLSIISGRAVGWPDISRPTSKPSSIPSSRWASLIRVAETSRARSTPMPRASSRRGADTSVMTILRAPACRATAAAISPMGPAPVMRTSSPMRGWASAVCTAFPSGSKIAPSSGVITSSR